VGSVEEEQGGVERLAFPTRHAISRARQFLGLADECTVEQRDRCEAFMEAAIIFCRTALHRMQSQYERRPGWKAWWDGLLNDPDLNFIRQHRDWIVKEAPEKFNQVIYPGQVRLLAVDCYYYEHHTIRATTTLRRCLDATERHIRDADARFG
jgi:hypothetical protein